MNKKIYFKENTGNIISVDIVDNKIISVEPDNIKPIQWLIGCDVKPDYDEFLMVKNSFQKEFSKFGIKIKQ